MGYSVHLYSVDLSILDEFLGSSDQDKFDAVVAILACDFDPYTLWSEEYRDFAERVHSIALSYLSQIIFEGNICNEPANEAVLGESNPYLKVFASDFATQNVLQAIFMTDPLFRGFGNTSHIRYTTTQELLKERYFDDQAQIYWDYLCSGRGLDNCIIRNQNYYAYLRYEELEYLVEALSYIPRKSNVKANVISSPIFEKKRDITDFEQIVETHRDLFVIAG
jgi:hypothetical protein